MENDAENIIETFCFIIFNYPLSIFNFDPFPLFSNHMSQLTDDEVRHIAKLARLNVSDAEVKKFGKELSSILEYIDRLQEVDTENVDPLKSITGISNVEREDEVRTDGPDPDALLECSPLPIVDHQIQTPSAHG